MLVVLSMIFIVMNHVSPTMKNIVADLSLITLPLQKTVDAPIKAVHRFIVSFGNEHQIIAENAKLRAHELLLQAKLQRLLELEKENLQLHQLLRSTAHIDAKVQEAQLLAVDLDPNLQQVILDKGSKQHIYVGQPVLDAYGVMGQVVDVGPLTSKVLLITDQRSAIPVQDFRNGVRAVAAGLGATGQLKLINIPDTSDVRQGDLFVTSGLGLRYPVGYPVAVVDKVDRGIDKRFATIILAPLAHLDRTQQVLVAWPTQAQLAKTVMKQLSKKLPSVKVVDDAA